MSIATPGGSIDVNLEARAGRIVRVDIRSERAFGIGRLAVGRSADSAVVLIGRVFSLCATAQSVAAVTAIETARAQAPDPRALRARVAAVIAERMVELLRGTLTMLAGLRFASLAPAMRRIASTARGFDLESAPQGEAAGAMIAELAQALAAVGLAPDVFADACSFDRWLRSEQPVTNLLRPLVQGDEVSFGARDLKPLHADADRLIGARLRERGPAFSAKPTLAGQVPETGALARNAGDPLLARLIERHGAGVLVRLLARLIEACQTPARLRAALIEQDDAVNADVVRSYAMGAQTGLSAVECARGRLHHLAEVAADGKVARLEILAPTEWNFHPQGSLARALEGASIGGDGPARARIDRLVAAFDPCVGFRVNVAEVGHA